MVGHGKRFREPFRLVIDPTRSNRINVPPIALRLGAYIRITIHLGRGGHEKSRAFCQRQSQAIVRSKRADLQRLDGDFQIIGGAGGRGEIQYGIHSSGNIDKARQIVNLELKTGIGPQMAEVCLYAGDQIVEAQYFPTFFNEAIAKMRSKKPRTARYHSAQSSPLPSPDSLNRASHYRRNVSGIRPSEKSDAPKRSRAPILVGPMRMPPFSSAKAVEDSTFVPLRCTRSELKMATGQRK